MEGRWNSRGGREGRGSGRGFRGGRDQHWGREFDRPNNRDRARSQNWRNNNAQQDNTRGNINARRANFRINNNERTSVERNNNVRFVNNQPLNSMDININSQNSNPQQANIHMSKEIDIHDMPIYRPKKFRPLSFNDLHNILIKDADEMLDLITTQQSGFPNALNDENLLKNNILMNVILSIFKKAFTCDYKPAAINMLLSIIKESIFFKTCLIEFFNKMSQNILLTPGRTNKQPIKDSLILIKELVKRLPNSYMICSVVVNYIELSVRTLRTQLNYNLIDQDIEDSLIEVKELLITAEIELTNKKEIKKENLQENTPILEDHTPPDNFREISIFPRPVEDIHTSQKVFLRPIKIKGEYLNVQDYLDIHFRLLREDFIRPLRNGIKDYMSLRNSRGGKKLKDIKVYHNVHILNPICMHNGIHYRIQFDTKMFNKINWEISKRLIYGSLICLSLDDFNDIFIASVSDRNIKELNHGIITVQFETRKTEIRNLSQAVIFTMVETSSYFEAYRHVLEGLQKIEDIDMPFKEQILYCNKNIMKPEYLLLAYEPIYTINLKKPKIIINNEEDIVPIDRFTRINISDNIPGDYKIKILDTNSWPSHNELSLDKSQLTALMNSLTNKLSIIQGPPGTGKTFIGLKIVSHLLENKKIWSSRKDMPILVVCYTNHALDQFLEGIYKFMKKGIVRIGSRSKSEIMSKFTLTNIKKELRETKNVRTNIYLGRKDIRRQLEIFQNEIEEYNTRIETSEKGILTEDVLNPYISRIHYGQFFQYQFEQTYEHSSKMPNWLLSKNFDENEQDDYEENNIIDQNKKVNLDDLIEVINEVELEETNRRLEIDENNIVGNYRDKKIKERIRMQQISDKDLACNFGNWNVKTNRKKKKVPTATLR